jgi:methionyl-tRNA formyltransferase
VTEEAGVKALLFCSPQGNQRALAHRIAQHIPLAAIVTVVPNRSRARKKPSLTGRAKALATRAVSATVGLPLRRAWFGMLAHFERRYPAFPIEPSEVADINLPEVLRLVEQERPDLVIVSGTNLLKGPLIEKIRESGAVVNLHTGISPYVKGGPNCTNWCLAKHRFDLIGNTIMWIDTGIDTGNIIATERTPLDGTESLTELHIKVMDHAHDLYVRCIKLFAQGVKLSNIPQDELGDGWLFLTRHWTVSAIISAVANFARAYRPRALLAKQPINLVSPTEGLVSSA